MKEYLIKLINNIDFLSPYSIRISNYILFILLLLLAYLSYKLVKPMLLKLVLKITKNSKSHWDDILLKEKFFHKTALLVPLLIIYYISPLFTDVNPKMHDAILMILEVFFTIAFVQIVLSFLSTVNSIFETTEKGKHKSIKGYVQVGKILIYFLAFIIIFSTIADKNPLSILAGLGAFAAIIILVFQDSIKGLVSGVQLSANDMVRIGDWISMPKYGADGDVIDISLNTVKVQNWDKTISMVPTYALVSESFSNWRGMEESGGRRIKRSIYIDVNSIHFLSSEEKERLSNIELISGYILDKQTELEQFNQNIKNAEKSSINGRQLTNIGTFRKYLEEYLKANNNINNEMTFMVRQLQSSEQGLPLEIYAFSNIKSWVEYEAIQSDIFDHVFSALHTFNLKIFQNPSGEDFKSLSK